KELESCSKLFFVEVLPLPLLLCLRMILSRAGEAQEISKARAIDEIAACFPWSLVRDRAEQRQHFLVGYPFTAPAVSPDTILRWKKSTRITSGIVTMMAAAAS